MSRSLARPRTPPLWVIGAACAALVVLFAIDRARAQVTELVTVPLLSITNVVQTVKATAGPLLAYSCNNPNTAAAYVQVFDTAAAITLGTTLPRTALSLPPSSGTGVAEPVVGTLNGPIFASNSIRVAATTTAAGAIAPSSPVACDFFTR